MIDIEDIRKLLYASLDGDKIRDSKVDFAITTTQTPSMRMLKIYKEDMIINPLEYILSSLYLPAFSSQRIIDDSHYVDISRFRRYPLEMLKEKGCNNIYVVNNETNNLRRINRPIRKNFCNERITFINYETKPSILDFSLEQSEKNYNNGYETTIKLLEKRNNHERVR